MNITRNFEYRPCVLREHNKAPALEKFGIKVRSEGRSNEIQEYLGECQHFPPDKAKVQNQCKPFKPACSLKRKMVLAEDFVPTQYSVVCGRTQNCYNHTGNRRFRVTVKMHLQDYADAKGKTEKSQVVSKILELIREASPEGSFVTKESDGRWYEVSDRVAREKIGAQFRDYLHSQYRSSAKSKQARKVGRQELQQYQSRQLSSLRDSSRYLSQYNTDCGTFYDSAESADDRVQSASSLISLGSWGFRESFS